MKYQKELIGETLGTFILVLFGCASVLFVKRLEPAMKKASLNCNCNE